MGLIVNFSDFENISATGLNPSDYIIGYRPEPNREMRSTVQEFFNYIQSFSGNDVNTTVKNNSGNWNSVYSTVKSLSDSWEESAVISPLQSASGFWDIAYSNLVSNSANYLLSGTDVYLGDIPALSSDWNSVYSTVNTNSANYILDGGNTKGSNLLVGTSDNFNLNLETNGIVRFSVTNIGAIQEGENTLASGIASHAEGSSTTATGSASHAEGGSTNATGLASHAEGNFTFATGESSHSQNYATSATNYFSHAEGDTTLASGYASHAEGSLSKAIFSNAHAEGKETLASGLYSHSEGNNTVASGNYSHAEGFYTSTGNRVLFDTYTFSTKTFTFTPSTSGNFSFLNQAGYDDFILKIFANSNYYFVNFVSRDTNSGNIIIRDDVIGVDISSGSGGWIIDKNGKYGHSEGNSTQAGNDYAHAEGTGSIATGTASHAEGSSTIASGTNSHAEGSSTIASGTNSHAEGNNTRSTGNTSHAAGRYSEAVHNRTWVWHGHPSNTTPVSSTRADQFLVSATGGIYFPGNVGIGTDNNTNSLTVNGNISATGSIITSNYKTSLDWANVWSTTNTNSGNWGSVYSTVNTNSGNWGSVYSTVNTNSGNWGSVYSTVNTNSGNWGSVYSTVNTNSANYILDGGNTKGSNLLVGTSDNFNLNLETNNSIRATITNAGNVGVGTQTPGERFSVTANISALSAVYHIGNPPGMIPVSVKGTSKINVMDVNSLTNAYTVPSGKVFVPTGYGIIITDSAPANATFSTAPRLILVNSSQGNLLLMNNLNFQTSVTYVQGTALYQTAYNTGTTLNYGVTGGEVVRLKMGGTIVNGATAYTNLSGIPYATGYLIDYYQGVP